MTFSGKFPNFYKKICYARWHTKTKLTSGAILTVISKVLVVIKGKSGEERSLVMLKSINKTILS